MEKKVNPLRQLKDFGQSVWLDYIRRHLLQSKEFRRLIEEDGVEGMTSNPTIFEKAIAGSTDYDDQLADLAKTGKRADEIYEALSLADIRTAADALRPIYDRTSGISGFVSYEVSPTLAGDADATVKAAHRYFELIDRPNLMIKVPATPACIPAIEQLIAEGHNINVTLTFSINQYEAVARAYIRGLEKRAQAGERLDRIASVASVFVSRVDTLVDRRLEEMIKVKPDEAVAALRGTAAVANAKLIYQRFKELFRGAEFRALAAKGARVQRPLWASTGTKNPQYSDIKYVEELIGPDTVNTMPPATMDAFRDHGEPRASLEEGVAGARETVARLKALGLDLNDVGNQLQEEGVKAFAKSFDDLHAVIDGRRQALVRGALDSQTIIAAARSKEVEETSAALERDGFTSRLWRKDPTLWKAEPEHQQIIRNSLGWLNIAEVMAERVYDLEAFASEAVASGFRDVVLLGMGGSSLCPALFAQTFASRNGYPRLHVLDSTVPSAISQVEKDVDLERALFLVSSKSGGTIETISHFGRFFALVKERKGQSAGLNFVAITDPGTSLERTAHEYKFRRAFLNPPDIGGRYSALSYFGLVPAALMGIDIAKLLDRAVRMMQGCAGCLRVDQNAGVKLGAALGALHRVGRDKITFMVSPGIRAFGLWAEQLLAESTGKEGTGLIPVVDEPLGKPATYGSDRLFVYVCLEGEPDAAQERLFDELEKAGAPLIRVTVADKIDIGEEFLRWEIATATVGSLLKIDAFDQPNVQESKDNTNRLLQEYERRRSFTEASSIARDGNLSVYCSSEAAGRLNSPKTVADGLRRFLKWGRTGDYFAIMAYLAPAVEVDREISAIRASVRDRLKLATTFGYGPRFLHSTGQLHKGGPNTGLFLQITQEHSESLPIPGVPYDFARLNEAQYLGDFQALVDHGRRVMRVHLSGNPVAGLAALSRDIGEALN
jgi:transaldolase / glucose-6-phosphate isomerase